MKKIFNENGFLNEDGKDLVSPFKVALEKISSLPEVKEMSVAELRVLGSVLSKELGDYFSKTMQAKSELFKKLESMTDEQFETFLKVKYGNNWRLTTLSVEEYSRVPRLSQEKIGELLQEGASKVSKFPVHGVRFK